MRPFKIAAAQVPSVRGDIASNIATHASAVETAAKVGVHIVVFPELSLTGYEPDLAAALALTKDDVRLKPLTDLARQHQITIIVGAPLRNGDALPAIGAIVFAPESTRSYRKMHLGTSERPFFSSGHAPLTLKGDGHTVGLAICADASQASHPQTYAELGADVYATGVCLNAEWYETDMPRLASHAKRFRMSTLMANHGASVGTYASVGKSAVWGPDGALLAQADGTENALLIATYGSGAWRGDVITL